MTSIFSAPLLRWLHSPCKRTSLAFARAWELHLSHSLDLVKGNTQIIHFFLWRNPHQVTLQPAIIENHCNMGLGRGITLSLPGCTVGHKSRYLRKPYFTEPSHGHVWVPGQTAAQMSEEPGKDPSRWDAANTRQGRFVLRTSSLVPLSWFPFLMTLSHCFHRWSCCIAGSQRVKMEGSICTFKTTCDKVHCLKSGSFLPFAPPQLPVIIYYRGVLWYKFDNLPYTLALF